MRALAVLMLAPFALAACGERAEEGAPTPAEVVSAAPGCSWSAEPPQAASPRASAVAPAVVIKVFFR